VSDHLLGFPIMINRKYIHRLEQKEPHILILIIMSSFASMGAIIFTPALPEIGEYFNVSQGHSQLTISLFLLGYAIGQLIYGPLANRFGRKPAFFIGVFISTLGSIFSILSEPFQSFELLIFGRVLEALGSSAGFVISFTIINDHYYPEQSRRVVAYLMLSFAIVPGMATFIGGILVAHFHWVSCFYFLLFYGLLLGIAASLLKETSTSISKQALHFRQIKKGYTIAFKDKLLRTVSLFFGLSGMCVYIYAATMPFIAINYFKMTPQEYGLIGLIPYVGTALGSLISARLSATLNAKSLMKIGLIIDVIVSMTIAISFYFYFINIWFLILCGFCFMFGNCLIAGNGASIATTKVEDKANASAIMSFITVSMPMSGTFLIALIPGSQILKLSIGFLIAMFIMLNIWFFIIESKKI
jgi:DHA1 family bicyclomycin/chloramphenicol resistance-like MFS transporter